MIGLLGRKKGMASVFVHDGKQIAVTVLEVGPCPVVQVKTTERDKYNSIQLAFDPIRPKLVNRPASGHFESAGVIPHRLLREFRDFEGEYKAGDVLKADIFKDGDIVHVTGVSKGRGFAGVIKRHGFTRPNQSHGTHEAFRGPGSIGQASYPARVWPGKRMPGRMGGARVTIKNLPVVKVDVEKSLIMVKGAVPGPPGSYISLRKAG
ncbi:MAG: 50S ribosomal protein L3 [Calditrichaeota bacterium]|nr:50S ribosomal protein L3 [Calditrichota bacterium]